MSDDKHTVIFERPYSIKQLNRLVKLSRMNLLSDSAESEMEDLAAIMHEITTLMPDLSRKEVSLLDERDGLVAFAEIEKQIASSLNTSDRPYRAALPTAEVVEYMRAQSGTHFDPELLKVFLALVESGEIQ